MQPSRRTLLRAGIGAMGLRLLAPALTSAAVAGCDGTRHSSSTVSPRASEQAADTARVQAALGAEQVAVYGYGVVLAWLAGAPRRAALAALDAHRGRAQQLAALLRQQGVTPGAAAAAYALPFPVNDARSAAHLAMLLEQGVIATARRLTGSPRPPVRALAVTLLAEAQARAATWRGLSG